MRDFSSSPLPLILSAVVVVLGLGMAGTAGIFIALSSVRTSEAATPTYEPIERDIIISTATTAPTNTPLPPTPTVESTAVLTNTPAATVTTVPPTNAPTNQPLPTHTPTVTFTPSATVNPYTDARVSNASFTVLNPNPKVNEHIIFRFSITNASGSDLQMGYAGPGVFNSAGTQTWYQQSWSNFTWKAGSKLDWEDWVAVQQPGTYTLKMMVCFSSTIACDNGTGEWKVVAPPVTITATQ